MKSGDGKMKCSNCFVEKEITEFNLSNSQKTRQRQYMCKDCHKAYHKAWRASKKDEHATVDVQSKVCYDCRLEKPRSQFGKKSVSKDKLNEYCKPCWRERVYTSKRKAAHAR